MSLRRNCPTIESSIPCGKDQQEIKKKYYDKSFSICCYNSKKSMKKQTKGILKKLSKKSKNITTCMFDDDSGICEINSDSNINDDKCEFDKLSNECIYSKSYIEKRDKDVILVMQSKYDHNQAFNTDGDPGLINLLNQFENFRLIFKKISSINDIKKIVNSLGKKIKIVHLIVMAHGSPTFMQLSKTKTISMNDNSLDEFVKIIKPKLSVDCSILLHSCLVGKNGLSGDNFANALASKLPGHVIFGSEESIKRGDLSLIYADDNFNKRSLLIWYEIDPEQNYQIYSFRKGINSSKIKIKSPPKMF